MTMFSRRKLLLGGIALFAMQPVMRASAHSKAKNKVFKLHPRYRPQSVRFTGYSAGTIVVDPDNHFLYLIESRSRARRYGIGVGKAGRGFKGTATIARKAEWPSWRPTDNMIRREPKKYARYAKGVPGGPGNPLGARALYLYKGGRDTYYRIHGTTQPSSVGRSVSNGCIRMINEHVIDLFNRVPLGTTVVVI
jgi:lipoprotein-anchoring transpeptidase ErfK/SrfK